MSASTTLGLKMQVSPDAWKNASAHNMKLSQAIISRCDRGIKSSRQTDPLPLLRDVCIRESNDRIHAYVRATRAVVVLLRRKLVATNEEIKSLSRGKEALERALDHTRKDLALNHQSIELRALRPPREKEPDAADLCLHEEQAQLLGTKQSLESQLSSAQQQLQILSMVRARLAAVLQERSRVTDLLCHSMSRTVAVSHFPTNGHSSQVGFLPPSMVPGYGVQRSKSAQGMYRGQRSQAYSAPVPLQLSVIREDDSNAGSGGGGGRGDGGGGGGTSETWEQDEQPDAAGDYVYDSFSPESRESVQLASEAILTSQEMRRQLRSAIENRRQALSATHRTVNEGFTRKLAETVTLSQHLQVNAGQTSLATLRAQRCLQSQEKGYGYLLGPESSSNLTTREKLDRPLVKVYQRHPGTELPEAAHFAQASSAYTESLQTTRKNIMLLKLAQKGLQADIRDKKMAAEVDSGIVRLRRQKANHRWVMDGQSGRPPLRPSLKLYIGGGAPPGTLSGGGGTNSRREDGQRRRITIASGRTTSTK